MVGRPKGWFGRRLNLAQPQVEWTIVTQGPPHRLAALLDQKSMAPGARIYRLAEGCLIILGIVAMMANTSPNLSEPARVICQAILIAIVLIFLADAALRLAFAPQLEPQSHANAPRAARIGWAWSLPGALDLLTILPITLAAPFYWTPDGAPLLASLWLLRFARYSAGPQMLMTVLLRERVSILGLALLFAVVLVAASVLAYLAEAKVQPDAFGSVGDALWWTITTLTTTGYGDRVPMTGLGRALGGLVMVSGIILFALLAGLLATSFAAEMRRRDFLQSWDMLSRVPFFREAGPSTIADLAALLRPRELPSRAIVTRKGQPGDCMFFIIAGEVEILIEPQSVRLGPGDFFGEIALITGGPRNATVMTTRETQLLVLDIADFRGLAASRPELTASIGAEAARRMATPAAAPAAAPAPSKA
jgi:voltage-gated potassium channel